MCERVDTRRMRRGHRLIGGHHGARCAGDDPLGRYERKVALDGSLEDAAYNDFDNWAFNARFSKSPQPRQPKKPIQALVLIGQGSIPRMSFPQFPAVAKRSEDAPEPAPAQRKTRDRHGWNPGGVRPARRVCVIC